jgi:hypothetical protein
VLSVGRALSEAFGARYSGGQTRPAVRSSGIALTPTCGRARTRRSPTARSSAEASLPTRTPAATVSPSPGNPDRPRPQRKGPSGVVDDGGTPAHGAQLVQLSLRRYRRRMARRASTRASCAQRGLQYSCPRSQALQTSKRAPQRGQKSRRTVSNTIMCCRMSCTGETLVARRKDNLRIGVRHRASCSLSPHSWWRRMVAARA